MVSDRQTASACLPEQRMLLTGPRMLLDLLCVVGLWNEGRCNMPHWLACPIDTRNRLTTCVSKPAPNDMHVFSGLCAAFTPQRNNNDQLTANRLPEAISPDRFCEIVSSPSNHTTFE